MSSSSGFSLGSRLLIGSIDLLVAAALPAAESMNPSLSKDDDDDAMKNTIVDSTQLLVLFAALKSSSW